MLRQFLKDSFVYGVSNAISRGISLVIVPLYTRIFSPVDYGIIDILAVVTTIVSLTTALEISQSVARYYPDAKIDRDKIGYASTALWFTVFTYSLFLVFVLILSAPLSKLILETVGRKFIFQIWAFSTFGNGIFYLLQNQLRWQLKPVAFAVSNILYSVVSTGCTIFLVVVLHFGVVGVFYGLIAGSIIGSLYSWYSAKKSYMLTFDWHKYREMLAFSVPLVPSSIAVFVSLYVDRIAIKELTTLGNVGLYGIGYRFASIIGIVFVCVQTALMPLIYANYTKSSTQNELAKIFRYFLAFILPLTLILGLFAREALRIFTTSEYYSAFQVVPLLSYGILFSNMNVFAPGLAIAKRTKSIAAINIGGGLLSAGLNFSLIPFLGINGAALAFIISAAFKFSAYMVLSQRFYAVPHRWLRIIVSVLFAVMLSLIGTRVETVLGLSLLPSVFVRALLLVCGILLFGLLLIGIGEIKTLPKKVILWLAPSSNI